MPNWCANKLDVIGPKVDTDHFKHTAHGPTSSYHRFGPNEWGALDDIRKAAIMSVEPEPGEVSWFSLHQLRPVPIEIRRLGFDNNSAKEVAESLGLKYPGMGGYGWQTRKWGTKWDVVMPHPPTWVKPDNLRNHLNYSFYTAWTPPEALIEYVSRKWPTIDFELAYREEGLGIAGWFRYRAGECVMWDQK